MTNPRGGRPTLRVAINVYDLKEKSMRIFEMGAMLFKDVLKVREKYGLDTQAYEVERHGTGTNTSYSILPERKLTAQEQEAIAAAQLHNLPAMVSGGGSGSGKD